MARRLTGKEARDWRRIEFRLWHPIDIAWAAGIVDGEGYIGICKRGNKLGASVAVGMTDFDIIYRLYDTFGIGTLYREERSQLNWKDKLIWTVQKHEDIIRFLTAIYPMMGIRRQERILKVVEEVFEARRKPCKVCNKPFLRKGNTKWAHYCSQSCKRRQHYENLLAKREGSECLAVQG